MNAEKQVEEMADDIDQAIDNNMTWHDIDGITNIDTEGMAKELTAKGYIKQSQGEWIEKHRHRGGFETFTGIDHMGEKHTIRVDRRYECDDLYCSICGKLASDVSLNYCSNCGAKMKGGAE